MRSNRFSCAKIYSCVLNEYLYLILQSDNIFWRLLQYTQRYWKSDTGTQNEIVNRQILGESVGVLFIWSANITEIEGKNMGVNGSTERWTFLS